MFDARRPYAVLNVPCSWAIEGTIIQTNRGWVMVRRIDVVVAVLALAAAIPVVPASAQNTYSAPSSPGYSADPPSHERSFLRSLFGNDDDQQRGSRRVEEIQSQPIQSQPLGAPGAPSRITPDAHDADAGLPPPGFAVPPGQNPPAAIAPQANPDSVRPPGAIGAAPSAVPPAAAQPNRPMSVATLPPDDQPETGQPQELAPNLKRQLVDFQTKEPAGTIIVDTPHTYLYLVLGGGKALRYGVRVGREGFTWAGTERVTRMKEWPDWFPPAEMIDRQPYLPRFTAGGPGNPLGARALYLGKTEYRIHGTNQPSTIGKYVSSGCVGMLNDDIEDLYNRVQVGTRVVVMPFDNAATAAANIPAAPVSSGPAVPAQAAPAGATIGAASSSGGPAISSSPLAPPSNRR
jgi:lipoprotein-anchoring transpeptidase ErfK/SrfK